MNSVAIHACQIRASLGNHQVLHDVELSLSQSRWTCIVGPNGAGKSTLLKVLAGLLPHSGQVTLLGRDMRQMPAKLRAQQLSWLGQNEGSADDLTVRDVAMLSPGWAHPARPIRLPLKKPCDRRRPGTGGTAPWGT
jgi:iron complex transport system ATP-binding protein